MTVGIQPAQVLRDTFLKLDPRIQLRNPVMFVVYVGSLLTALYSIAGFWFSDRSGHGFTVAITLWLWFTVLFANFAEALAEGRSKAQAQSLKGLKKSMMARKYVDPVRRDTLIEVPSETLRKGDVIRADAGQLIAADGEVIEGVATVDESAITGESAPVLRESGGDLCSVTGSTKVLSDYLIIRVVSDPGESFLDQMIRMVEGAKRQKTPNEIALTILLVSLTLIFLLCVTTLYPMSVYSVVASGIGQPISVIVLIALLVCLIPTTISGLLSAIGVAGMSRMMKENVIARSGKAVEAAGDVDVLLLDKTGTITYGNRQASAFIPSHGVSLPHLAWLAHEASTADETPEGRSIVALAGAMQISLADSAGERQVIPFSAQTRMSGVDMTSNGAVLRIRKGAVQAIEQYCQAQGNAMPQDIAEQVRQIAQRGSTPLAIAENAKIVGCIELKDVVKPDIRERFAQLRTMGIKTVMITGDNPLTAAAIAAEAGVDDYVAQATPQTKLDIIRDYQRQGHLVAMTGDGTNDAPALAQADVAVAMNCGTQAAREASNMVDLDSDPTKLLQVVKTGKQMLMTRGALTTFSIANDVAKYFAIIPAAFVSVYPQLGVLNVMQLHSPESAVLSAVIFNAVIIIVLIPLALRGVTFRAQSAAALLRRNLLIYAAGGLLAPFAGIKLIDLMLSVL
ncbi:MAG TPA: potassium-transporting ATPase subunit KdpB [Advenella sp.]|nr:potassium-transporting ATPase subunit KdpB [Advenella sp.]